MNEPRVGFIGIGTMGRPMATNLLKRGLAVTAHNRTPAKAEALVGLGATVAATPRAAAEGAAVVITMLPRPADVRLAVLGADGVLAGLAPGAILIDMSTTDPGTARELSQQVGQAGGEMLDAPVSGSTARAETGELTIMVGGAAATLERARPVLAALGTTIIHCGEAGAGQIAKLVNNVIAGITMVAVAEGFALGVKAGLSPELLYQVVRKSSGNSWCLENRVPYADVTPNVPAKVDFAPGFACALMGKDLSLVLAAAQELGVALPTAGVVRQLYTAAEAAGDGGKDFSVVARALTRLAGQG
jgi:3-hydroxyisobutyrate dehydrogenase